MPISQNVIFRGDPPEDTEYPDPPGALIARLLKTALTKSGWKVREFENWRDAGWSLPCQRGLAELEVTIGPSGDREWLLQVAPMRVPGMIGALLGRRPSANPLECLELARAVHTALLRTSIYTSPEWRWDGMPDEGPSTREPQEWSAS